MIKKGVGVITDVGDSGEVTLCEVGRIYISRNSVVWLSLRALEIVEFNSHLHSWAAANTTSKL